MCHYIVSANYLNEAAEYIEAVVGETIYKVELYHCDLPSLESNWEYIRVYSFDMVYGIDCGKYSNHRISYEDLSALVNGCLEVHFIDELSAICDKEGKLKGLRNATNINGISFVGTVVIGRLTDKDLEGVERQKLISYI